MPDEKPAKRQQLSVDIEATPEAVWKALTEGPGLASWFAPIAQVEGRGVGAKVTFAWSEQMKWTTNVDGWDEGRMVRWLDHGVTGEGTALAAEFTVESVGGKVRVTLVQSGFGAAEGWDDFFDGTEVGWTYFLRHLRIWLERHAGRMRHMIDSRFPVKIGRAAAWRALFVEPGTLLRVAATALTEGGEVPLQLEELATPAVIELAIEGRALALRLPQLGDALLFLEFGMGAEEFHVGAWFSVFDADLAQRLRAPAARAFERAAAAVAG